MSDSVVHIIGLDVMLDDYHRRQRCAWCGALLADDDLSRMAWPLHDCPDCAENEHPDEPPCSTCNGTRQIDPGPPGPWPVGALLEVAGELGGFRALGVVELVDGKLPENCCAKLDPDITR